MFKTLFQQGGQILGWLAMFSACVGGAYLISGAADPARVTLDESGKGPVVEGRTLAPRAFEAPIIGNGTARVPQLYVVRAQVPGEILELSPNFLEGRRVAKDEVLFRIDPKDVNLAIAEIEATLGEIDANIQKIESQVGPIDAEIDRLRQDLIDQQEIVKVQEEAVALSKPEVERLARLVASGNATPSALEQAKLALNQQQQALVLAKSRVAQDPILIRTQEAQKLAILSEKTSLEAKKKVVDAQRARQQVQLERCVVSSPVEGIVLLREHGSGRFVKQLSLGDVISAGFDLAWIMPIEEGIEIPVALNVDDALWIRGLEGVVRLDANRAINVSAFLSKIPQVDVSWFGHPDYKWKGRIDRFVSELDPTTRTITVIVKIKDTGGEIVAGERIPLTQGMYCEVAIPSRVVENAIVIPRSALREGERVYVASGGRLDVRTVKASRSTDDEVVIQSGLSAGETLILSDLPQAIPGMEVSVLEEK